MRQRSWIAILASGLVPLVPAALNVTVGDSLGVWWAPFPMWIFFLAALGLPLGVSAVVPAGVFVAVAIGVVAGRRGFAAGALWLIVASSVVHVSWMVYVLPDGIERHGLVHTATVFGLGTTLLSVSWGLCVLARRRNAAGLLVASTWCAMLWWAWVATPWLGEGI